MRRLDVSFHKVAVGEGYNIVRDALKLRYDVHEVPPEHAQVVFAGEDVDGRKYPQAITFFIPIELWWPKLSWFDYSLGFQHIRHPRYYRLPYYVFELQAAELIKPPDFVDRVMAESRDFCSFVVSNANRKRTYARLRFFEVLNAKRRVDSGGAAFNNIGGPLPMGPGPRQEFIRKHRFHIAFENKQWRGYVTEKIAVAMSTGTIPIYWGCPDIGDEFNPASFIDAGRFRNFDAACEHVLAVADDRDRLVKILREPWFRDNKPNHAYDLKPLGEWLDWAIREGKQPLRSLFPGHVAYKKYELFRGRLISAVHKLRMG